jgi:hypothetical protein
MTAYYFGNWRSDGHATFIPGMQHTPPRTPWYPPTPWKEKIDGTLTPGDRGGLSGARLSYEAMSATHQSEGALYHKDGWTALAFHDFTGDSRPNSQSVFFFDEVLGAGEACAAAARDFPEVWFRLEQAAPVRIVETHA